ncbi:LytTR family DNA-binding domain-containing protein [Anaerolentibacter hominis]|uniref:LytTR family DNA-binding domain-containing protein n=1 Tax=Anaerolentibacter hominis TaxID=3079009 RepID=UPI0031B8168E
MKLHIQEEGDLQETEITIRCRRLDKNVEKIVAMLRIMEQKLTGEKEGQTYILDASEVLYIDTADKKTFLYTGKEVYETSFKLYELEEQLADSDFFRAGKSCIINFNQIRSIRPDLDGKLMVTMNNDERLAVSRQYAGTIKKKLGVR